MTDPERHPRIYLTEEMTDTEDRVLRTWLGRREAESGEPTVPCAPRGRRCRRWRCGTTTPC